MPIPHPEPLSGSSYSAVELTPENDAVLMLDQRRLPNEEHYERLTTSAEVARGIRDMVVRGAPAIGIAAAYGMVLGARQAKSREELGVLAAELRRARPTAVNLMWAVDRMLGAAARSLDADALAVVARAIHKDDVRANRRMGELGQARVPDGATILTHCNAGALATGGYGTALGVIRAAVEAGKRVRVLADETRPYLQGLRLTAWELNQDGIPVELLTDGMAGWFFSKGAIDLAIVGSDRIARNGDVANKIGTYSVACLARLHERPFYVAAPWSTVDVACPSGADIPIEERSITEITHFAGARIAPEGVGARNPGFDVTPARLVSAIFTERGVIDPVGEAGVLSLESAGSL
ncbi:MAG: S-methyl-5-thioribose-1-phosphate isomerase [Polyangiaceae bacterium]|nr:S-methyl-5-thioribose-1-phosphate isomerase [Polyangiaceae bacterium]MCL4749286.1 S-methyl-5-thioribose-1-phosphate isomerase [Myxococcales bacterium]